MNLKEDTEINLLRIGKLKMSLICLDYLFTVDKKSPKDVTAEIDAGDHDFGDEKWAFANAHENGFHG